MKTLRLALLVVFLLCVSVVPPGANTVSFASAAGRPFLFEARPHDAAPHDTNDASKASPSAASPTGTTASPASAA